MRSPTSLRVVLVPGLLFLLLAASPGRADWALQDSGTGADLFSVQFLDNQNGFAVGASGTVLRTTDGGTSWTGVPLPSTEPVRDLSMIDATTGWVATGDPNNSDTSGAVWHTTDSGATWIQQPITSTRARLGIVFASAESGWACGARNGPIDIDATTDGGASWSNQSASNIFGWTYGIDAVSPSLAWCCGVVYFPAASGIVVHTTDGGAHWVLQNTGTIPFVYGIDFVTPSVGFTAGEQGAVLATTDGGTSWQAQASGTSVNLADVSFAEATIGTVCGLAGTILTTADGGGSWTLEETPVSVSLNGVFTLDANSAWAVGDGGTILKRTGSAAVRDPSIPLAHDLWCLPNPFRAETSVSYRLSVPGRVSLSVYSPAGTRLAVLAEGVETAGRHIVAWDGRDREGRRLPSGAYFLRLDTGGPAALTQPAILVR